jgi:hypothetical protein
MWSMCLWDVALKVLEPKGHPLVLEEAKGSGDGSFWHVCWVERNLVILEALEANSSMLDSKYTSGSFQVKTTKVRMADRTCPLSSLYRVGWTMGRLTAVLSTLLSAA